MNTEETKNGAHSRERDVKVSRDVPTGPYRAPEVHRLGGLDQVQATSYGNTYDGVYTNRSWWYTSG